MQALHLFEVEPMSPMLIASMYFEEEQGKKELVMCESKLKLLAAVRLNAISGAY